MLGYRLISHDSLFISRSFCPSCKQSIAFYDLIPLISWIVLRGRCRRCKAPISYLYPFIELLTLIIMLAMITYLPAHYWPAYFVFFSALIVVIRTDLQAMLISRWTSLYLAPLGIVFAYYGLLPITVYGAMLGAATGYGILWLTRNIFYWLTKKEGLGQGDEELMACIGAFTGLLGWWFTLLIASLAGTVVGLVVALIRGNLRDIRLPFGPFLALGAIMSTLFLPALLTIFLA